MGLARRDDAPPRSRSGATLARLTGAPLALVSAYVHEPGASPSRHARDRRGAALERRRWPRSRSDAMPCAPEHEVGGHMPSAWLTGAPSLHQVTAAARGGGCSWWAHLTAGRLGRVLAGRRGRRRAARHASAPSPSPRAGTPGGPDARPHRGRIRRLRQRAAATACPGGRCSASRCAHGGKGAAPCTVDGSPPLAADG